MTTETREAPEETTTPATEAPASRVATREANLPVGDIDSSRNHRRTRPGDEAKIAALMESIESVGELLQPIGVALRTATAAEKGKSKKGKSSGSSGGGPAYILMFGARRLEAVKRLGWANIPARVFRVTSDAEIESIRAVENIARQDISAVEQAQAVEDILRFYLEEHPADSRTAAIEFAAAQTGQTESWVRDHDYFTRLTEPVRDLALTVGMPAGHLRELAKVGSEEDQWSIALGVIGLYSSQLRADKALEPRYSNGQEVITELLAAAEIGTVRFMRIVELRQKVEASQRNLQRVHWDLSLPVLVGGRELPVCDGCPKNSASEPGLFGLTEAPEVRKSTCGDATCFGLKADAAEQGRKDLASKFAQVEALPSTDEVLKKLALKSIAKAGLDEKKAISFVKGRVKRRLDEGNGEAKKPGGSGGGSSRWDRKLTRHEVALLKFRNAYTDWLGQASGAIWAAALGDPAKKAALLIFQRLVIFDDWRMLKGLLMETPIGHTYGNEVTEVPKPAKALSKEVDAAVACVELVGVKAVWALAALECDLEECVDLSSVLHVEVAARLAAAFGAELPVMPVWEDFAPAAKQPTPAKKKVSKKKSSKKSKGTVAE